MIPQIFNYKQAEIKAHIDEDGNIWFVAFEICNILGIKNTSSATMAINDAYKGVVIISTLGGPQEVVTINESGLYQMLFRSRKPEAIKFSEWVYEEVLPKLRKEGQYSIKPTKPVTHLETAKQLVESLEDNEKLQNDKIQLIAEKEKLQPKADFADSALLPGMDINVSNFAKVNGMHPNLLKKWFRQQKIYMTAKGVKDKKYNTPFQIWMGYFNCIEETYENRKTGEKDHRILPLIKFEMQAKLLAKINKHAPDWVYKTKPKELSKS